MTDYTVGLNLLPNTLIHNCVGFLSNRRGSSYTMAWSDVLKCNYLRVGSNDNETPEVFNNLDFGIYRHLRKYFKNGDKITASAQIYQRYSNPLKTKIGIEGCSDFNHISIDSSLGWHKVTYNGTIVDDSKDAYVVYPSTRDGSTILPPNDFYVGITQLELFYGDCDYEYRPNPTEVATLIGGGMEDHFLL